MGENDVGSISTDLDVDDLIRIEAGHVGGEFWAGHDVAGEFFGFGA